MSKYKNIQEVLNNINELDKMYIKAKEYDKLTEFGKAELRCTFCGKPQWKAQKLIAHNNVYVCEHCVAVMNNICEKEVEGYEEIKKTV